MKLITSRQQSNCEFVFISHYVQMKRTIHGNRRKFLLFFISHYVQMKHISRYIATFRLSTLYPTTFRWNENNRILISKSISLYIPLRSDETRIGDDRTPQNLSFISHYVQMKREGNYSTLSLQDPLYPTTFRWNRHELKFFGSFDTLYIPLRSDETRKSTSWQTQKIYLYIPLRSDETSRTPETRPAPSSLYIPLRSDETADAKGCHAGKCFLYIPLRSDETVSVKKQQYVEVNFISHYVQMKPVNCSWSSSEMDANFISHYVQMKHAATSRESLWPNVFISHYVQMKHDRIDFDGPTGFFFISHYVQMKRVHGLHISHLTNYFISHYVQMKPAASTSSARARPFFISHYVQMKQVNVEWWIGRIHLYIPLRSDETYPRLYSAAVTHFFISHYVQMKRSKHRKTM